MPRRSMRSRLLPAVLAGAGGIAVIAFFATRPSPFATSHAVRDAHVGTNEKMGTDTISDGVPLDAGSVALELDAAVAEPLMIERREATRPATKPKPGTFSIDSTPFATIYVDDKRVGITPLVKKQLPAGAHRVRAVLKDGRTKEMTIDVPPGKSAAPVLLTW